VQRRLLGHFLDSAFAGASSQLVCQTLMMRPASEPELSEIRSLVDKLATRSERTNEPDAQAPEITRL
ncbi:MAG: hypothetical protein V3T31_11880, partial [candidate division Zixibacteria bacterium]